MDLQRKNQASDREWNIKLDQNTIDIRARLVAARLPSLQETLLKLMQQCQSDVVGLVEMLRLVEQDAGMAARILGLANSSAYNRGGPTATLEKAMQSIGTEMIKIIVINESVSQVFDKMSRSLGADLSGFWAHALQAGVAARMIAQQTGYSNVEEAYLSGLLHDVGRLALLSLMPREYVHHFHGNDDDDLCAVEERTLQTTHAEVGSWLVNLWKLDSFIADAVLYHHEPAARLHNAHPLTCITHLAHAIAGNVVDGDLEKSAALCALNPDDLQKIRSASWEQTVKSARDLNISLGAKVTLSGQPSGAADPVQEQLMQQVNGMMLTSTLERAFNRQSEQSELLELVTRSARTLFHFDSCVLLLMNDRSDALVGSRSGEHRQRLADFSLPLNMEGSTVALAARSGKVAFTPAQNPATIVMEEQFLRLLDTDHLACLPLVVEGVCLGMVIGGFKSWQLDDLKKRLSFLSAFSGQAALSLKAMQTARERQEQHGVALAREYREASRKVAHEVNNPLSIIKNYLGILDRKLLNMQAVSGEVGILNEEIDRVAKIINDFAEINLIDPGGKTDLGDVIEDIVRLFRQTEFISPLLQIEYRGMDYRCRVEGSADMLKQIFVNLIKNAAEAMTGAGMIEIGSDGEVSRDGILYVSVWVSDNGPGLAPEIMRTLFAPGHSTKGKGHSGLGLNIVHGLVQKMRGRIACQSSTGGTRFDILLPAAT